MKKRLLFLIAILLLSGNVVHATSLEDLEIKKKIAQQDLSSIKNNKSELEKKITEINEEAQELIKEIAELEKTALQLEEEISLTDIEIRAVQEDIKKNTDLLHLRLIEMYKLGEVSKLEILFNAKDFNDFLGRNTYMEKLTERDLDLLETLKSDKLKLDRLMAELRGKKKSLEIALENSRKSQHELELKKIELDNLLTELSVKESSKYSELSEIQRAIDEYQYAMIKKAEEQKKLAEEQLRLKKEIIRLTNEVVATQKEEKDSTALEANLKKTKEQLEKVENKTEKTNTKLHWIAGTNYITSPFGWRIDPFGSGKTVFHNGLDIAGPQGTPLYAAEDGVVTISGWGTGYGYYVEITHGNGLKTRYGHMASQPPVRVGQTVARGQYIGPMGSTGWSTGPHVHFEVWLNGKAVDPLPFLR